MDSQLYTHRQDLREKNIISNQKRIAMQFSVWLMKNPALFNLAGKVARKIVPILPKALIYNKLNIWGRQRDIPDMPSKSFKELYKEEKKR